jgi:hypothetical protein
MLLNSYNLGFLNNILPPNGVSTFPDLILAAYKADPFPSEVLHMLQDRVRSSKKISLGNVNNQTIGLTIDESYIFYITLYFTFISYNNTMIP